MAQEQEDKVPTSHEPTGRRLVAYEILPIQSIRASLIIISDQKWDTFFLKLSLMGGVIFLTSFWFILTVLFTLRPMAQLGGSIDTIVLGFLSRLLIGALLLFGYLWAISPALSQITDAEEVPNMSGNLLFIPTRWGFTLAGFFTLVGVVIFRYAIIESVQTVLPQAAALPLGIVAFGLLVLVWDMLYFGALMFGFGMVCLGRAYTPPEN